MDFELTADQVELRDVSRAFARNEMTALAKTIEETSESPSREWLERYAEMGFLGVNVSPDYGGLGLGDLEALIVLEEFAKVHPACAFPIFESCVGPIKAIERLGSESLKRRLIPEVCRGS